VADYSHCDLCGDAGAFGVCRCPDRRPSVRIPAVTRHTLARQLRRMVADAQACERRILTLVPEDLRPGVVSLDDVDALAVSLLSRRDEELKPARWVKL
jgi:hypothetical protein